MGTLRGKIIMASKSFGGNSNFSVNNIVLLYLLAPELLLSSRGGLFAPSRV